MDTRRTHSLVQPHKIRHLKDWIRRRNPPPEEILAIATETIRTVVEGLGVRLAGVADGGEPADVCLYLADRCAVLVDRADRPRWHVEEPRS